MKHYFTFGSGQSNPERGITDPVQQYITIDAPEGTDHRGLLLQWLGGNAFAFEYDESSGDFEEMRRTWALVEAVRITVTVNSSSNDSRRF